MSPVVEFCGPCSIDGHRRELPDAPDVLELPFRDTRELRAQPSEPAPALKVLRFHRGRMTEAGIWLYHLEVNR